MSATQAAAQEIAEPETTGIEELPVQLPSWKEEVNARLTAHRTRRGRPAKEQPALPGMEAARQESRAARVAARVAERYSKAPTYSEMLAQEAANAARAAEAAAAAAHDAHTAAQAILAGLDLAGLDMAGYDGTDYDGTGYDSDSQTYVSQSERREEMAVQAAVAEQPAPKAYYHVHPDSLPHARQVPAHESQNREAPISRTGTSEAHHGEIEDPFPDPFEEAFVAAAQTLPAKLLEFPRELVAARKARPRLAEGPLRDGDGPEGSQLRIFEVEPETISHQALATAPATEQNLPEWHSIRLDAQPQEYQDRRDHHDHQNHHDHQDQNNRPLGRQPAGKAAAHADSKEDAYTALLEMTPLHVAPMEDRLMAGIVDAALVLIAFALFVLVFVACTTQPPTGKPVIGAAVGLLAVFYLFYQWLFFTFAEGTPGMRYAKIALCTYEDENPTRKSMRNRVAALALSALPAGLGFLWALMDDDRMTWHDRITGTYQRSYR